MLNQQEPSVIIVQRLIPHYRKPFFRLLSIRNPDLEIKVFHGDKSLINKVTKDFVSTYFENHYIRIFGFSLVFQPSLLLSVLKARPKILILEGTFGVLTNFVMLVIRRIMGLPTLYWTAGWDNPGISGVRLLVKTQFIRTCLALSSGAICYGTAAASYLSSHGLPLEKITIAQNTIDVETLISEIDHWKQQGVFVRQKYKISSSYVVSYVGHISSMKRVNVLLQAFKLLCDRRNDVSLLIVGSGHEESYLKQFAKANGIPNVFFIGEVIDGVEAFFAASDVFVLPGTGGLALNQAMALGLPVISTVADGTQSDLIVDGENGYIVPVNNVYALMNAIDHVISSTKNIQRMGKKSVEIIRDKATLENMVFHYSYAIRKCLEDFLLMNRK